jgi:hypothetical protein
MGLGGEGGTGLRLRPVHRRIPKFECMKQASVCVYVCVSCSLYFMCGCMCLRTTSSRTMRRISTLMARVMTEALGGGSMDDIMILVSRPVLSTSPSTHLVLRTTHPRSSTFTCWIT